MDTDQEHTAMAGLELAVIQARNEAILVSMRRQKRENDHVDPDIVIQDLRENEDFINGLENVTRKVVQKFEDQVDTEIEEERRAWWDEEEHKKKLHAEFNAGIRNELAGMGADFYNKHK